MPLPPHISEVLDRFGIRAETKATLEDLFLSLGSAVFEVLAEQATDLTVVSTLTPEDLATIRPTVVENYLRKSHPQWVEAIPSPSLWHPRALEGRAAGLVALLGRMGDGEPNALVERIEKVLREMLGRTQPIPSGLLVLGRNAHFGGRSEGISFDIIQFDLEDALLVAAAEGRQHTVPGSVGETAGTYNGSGVAMLWEVQPNVLKPAGERNREIAKIYRKHRNWHVATLAAAMIWLRDRTENIYVLRGSGLSTAHEVNPGQPVSQDISDFHDRTIERVVAALGGTIEETDATDAALLLESEVLNTSLTSFVEKHGPADVIGRVLLPPWTADL